MNMNSIIKYFGGKNSMFKNIIEHFPSKGSYNTYIEPFGGSFGVGFHIPEDMIAPIEIYNDLEQNVYSLFKVLSDKEKYERFQTLCDISTYNERMREEFKQKLQDCNLDDVTRAFYFFYVNRTSFNGIGAFAVCQVVRRKMSKSTSDYLSTVERLPEIHQRLSKVIIANQDALKLMQRYDTENVFIYADPPYVQSTRGCTRYDIDMTDEQHMEFIDICCKAKAKILISGYDNNMYDRLCDNGFQKITFDVNVDKQKENIRTEVLWKNY